MEFVVFCRSRVLGARIGLVKGRIACRQSQASAFFSKMKNPEAPNLYLEIPLLKPET